MKTRRDGQRLSSGLLAVALVACSICVPLFSVTMPQAQAAGVTTLSETGATLLYPLFQLWIPDYARVAPNVSITAAATGSGKGIEAAISGEARMGASDAYMSDEQAQKNRGILNIA
jgi:phosphate transport system substrate-binding protein